MRAVVYNQYGPPDVLRLEEVKGPVPTAGEVLVKVHATTVNRLDAATREANRRSGPAVSSAAWCLASAGRDSGSSVASSPGRSLQSAPLSASSRSANTSSA